MKRITGIIAATILLGISWVSLAGVTSATTVPSLVISQFKITSSNGQFFTIFNNSSEPIDMATVQLVYFNNYNINQATSSKVIQLEGLLPAGGSYLVNDGPLTLCYRMVINSVSLGLSSTAGTIQLQRLTQSQSGLVEAKTEDYVRWSRSVVSGIQTLPPANQPNQFLLRKPTDTNGNPVVTIPGEGSWQAVTPQTNDPCTLTSVQVNPATPPSVIATSLLLLSSVPPPVTIISTTLPYNGPVLPAADIGLTAPIVNELLANPGSPQTDANDEFIELYNPNDKSFDLTGFKLQVGLTSLRKYTFPNGTILKPKSFTAFFSEQTNLALSNSGSQAVLLDPFGNPISRSKPYSSAKEDQAWALANNEWYPTITATPNAANRIEASGAAGGANSDTGSGNVRATTTNQSSSALQNPANTTAEPAQLHPGAVATITALAVGYGVYEYRQDVANKLRQFRSYRAARK